MLNISFLGGAREVGASCILVKILEKNLLMDCGIRQGAAKDILPDFSMIQESGGIDAIIISHAHMDHIGALPLISKEYPNARIYMNNMTKELMKVLLYDSLKIMNSREAEIPLYAEKDVEAMLDRIFTINYQVEFEIITGIKLSFYPAGHIAGASGVYITSEEGSLFYSGDFSIFKQRSIEGAKIPKLRPDAAIFEATYGDKLHSNREIEEDRLIDVIKDCIQNNGKMLIPAFALGRAQEVLLIIKSAINKGKLPKVKIYVDGMIKNINRVYKSNPLYLKGSLGKKVLRGIEPFYDDNISPVENREEREKLFDSKETVVVISSSGMMTGGPSQSYGEKIAGMENGYIVITGYQDEEAPGRKLLNLLELPKEERTMEINSKKVPVKCTIEKVGLSAHADKSEIKALIQQLSPRNIFLVHGEESVIEGLAGEVAREAPARVYVPKAGETIGVNIRVPRKQLKRQLQYLVGSKEEINEENIEKLWKFTRENYYERLFTIEELLIIWKGNAVFNSEEIENIKNILLSSPYFDNDARRFFMFKARSEEEVEEELAPKELKPNEINDLVKDYFGEYDFKKISIKLEEKKIILVFDFPKVVDEKINNIIAEFEDKFAWKVEINKETNSNAVENLIRTLFIDLNIKKISFLFNEDKVVVITDDEVKDNKKLEEKFKSSTGFDIVFQGNNKNANINEKCTVSAGDAPIMEQNDAFKYIDTCFETEKHKPYKKSIKTKGNMELSFISPVIGRKYIGKLELMARDIGWNIGISNSVNQNEILNIAVRLCAKAGIKLKKNPSFNLGTMEVTLKVEDGEEGAFGKIVEEFQEVTGCRLHI
ncbi:MBL fold metallo-hydrolase [Clostridium hydrogenum]|uniref:MBL fold metallo-hydrolase n=1 Tax=Clostridium hydrogenum TaxID=2855764 RepID=UPI001F264025|nr:MBL fold metallo-hydrolase [Clostridium hydrogenum]